MTNYYTDPHNPTPAELIEAAAKKQPHMRLVATNRERASTVSRQIILGVEPDRCDDIGMEVAEALLARLDPGGFVTQNHRRLAMRWALRQQPEVAVYVVRAVLAATPPECRESLRSEASDMLGPLWSLIA